MEEDNDESRSHCAALSTLCRVCGTIITGYRVFVTECQMELENAFNKGDFKNDNDSIHPKSVCRIEHATPHC